MMPAGLTGRVRTWALHHGPTLAVGSVVVPGGRERVVLVDGVNLALVFLAADLGPLLLVHLGLADVIGQRRRVRGGRYLVRVVGVDARLHAFLLGEPVQLVLVEAVDLAAVLPPVAVEPLGELIGELARLVYVLLRHRASSHPATNG